ncbi:MAG: DEAD/DEAH box helicase [Dokdonella sp.]|uniref:DEAD/DEAH box helicase n=1 Tax=Dokdonella sp. TaxID=2291710 RepID=UPI0032654FF0
MSLPDSLNLYVRGRISPEDAARQTRSAQATLDRFVEQPGVILGDEVGMGKTFVALAVAAAHVVRNPNRPVVIMVPRGVVGKWERDADTFSSACLSSPKERAKFRVGVAETGVDFLKLLDDPPSTRATVIVLAHGALNRKLGDAWSKLALLQAAIKGRQGVYALRQRVARWAGKILGMSSRTSPELIGRLLQAPPAAWKRILVEHGVLDQTADDPVPDLFVRTLQKLDLSAVYRCVVETLPERSSATINQRLTDARRVLDAAGEGGFAAVWREVLARMRLTLPLLVLDEAHRARHGGTQLAQLFHDARDSEDALVGPLAHRFDRMLFLTATPFQLGHTELCQVLSRFDAIAWKGAEAPAMGREAFNTAITALAGALGVMQLATVGMEQSWKRLLPPDLEEAVREHGGAWWQRAGHADDPACFGVTNERLRSLMLAFANAHDAIRRAEKQLRPWLLRSAWPLQLPPPHQHTLRRRRIEGEAVLGETEDCVNDPHGGLKVRGENALPFLLAARIHSPLTLGRLFAEGIASSYEALLDTHREVDAASSPIARDDMVVPGAWHLSRLRDCVTEIGGQGRSRHPKVHATVELAMSLWRRGEKVLIFCHYRQTGRALHQRLSEAMLDETRRRAAEKLGCEEAAVEQELQSFINRLDRDRAADVMTIVDAMLAEFPVLGEAATRESILDVVLRFIRTPTFLVRFANLDTSLERPQWVEGIFDSTDESSLSFRAVVRQFLDFLANRCGEAERKECLAALGKIQTGSHAGAEEDASFSDDEVPSGARARLVANVRRVYGDTREETRDRIMLTFNTPFYPEILIASSVMAEGVDLHLNCRHVIHHDLDWNPSALEQRTGRIDRLGCKAEQAGRSIRVYLPYVEGCQDEKMFRVVMDREQWFGVVMGADESLRRMLTANDWEVERQVEGPLVPQAMMETLRLRLDVA